MREPRLLWFAAGAATSSIAAVIGFTLQPEPRQDSWAIFLDEGVQSLWDGEDSAVWLGAEIARDCGARNFEMVPGEAADSSDVTIIPLVTDNNPALGCITDRLVEAELEFGIGLDRS